VHALLVAMSTFTAQQLQHFMLQAGDACTARAAATAATISSVRLRLQHPSCRSAN
jgi:hypothetical protein